MSEGNGATPRTDLAVRCEGVAKSYGLGEELSLQHTLSTLVRREHQRDRFWALSEVSFEVHRGEAFGIVGANGSGKSTLTQVVSGIAMQDAGRIEVWGRLIPLLEVGAGFHPELTGRENVALLGTILGLNRKAIRDEMEAITDFAGIHRYMDTPLKRYSSGMAASSHSPPQPASRRTPMSSTRSSPWSTTPSANSAQGHSSASTT